MSPKGIFSDVNVGKLEESSLGMDKVNLTLGLVDFSVTTGQ